MKETKIGGRNRRLTLLAIFMLAIFSGFLITFTVQMDNTKSVKISKHTTVNKLEVDKYEGENEDISIDRIYTYDSLDNSEKEIINKLKSGNITIKEPNTSRFYSKPGSVIVTESEEIHMLDISNKGGNFAELLYILHSLNTVVLVFVGYLNFKKAPYSIASTIAISALYFIYIVFLTGGI